MIMWNVFTVDTTNSSNDNGETNLSDDKELITYYVLVGNGINVQILILIVIIIYHVCRHRCFYLKHKYI